MTIEQNAAKRRSGNCDKCGLLRQRLNKDHIIPQWKDGSDTSDNIQYLCANCHEDKTIEDMKGYKHSEETRAKISLGVLNSLTHNRHVAEANRQRVRAPLSSEVRQRMSESAKRRWSKERGEV